MIKRIVAIALISTSPVAFAQTPDPFTEVRFCGEPRRTEDGRIYRSRAVLRAFKEIYPCPATGLSEGTCPGWSMDHVIPLACGGCDAVYNLQWLPNELKTTAGTGKDRFERVIYQTSIQCNPSAAK